MHTLKICTVSLEEAHKELDKAYAAGHTLKVKLLTYENGKIKTKYTLNDYVPSW